MTSMFDDQARHVAYIIDETLQRGARTVEPTEDGVQGWLDLLGSFHIGGGGFLADCTPGYYNSEQVHDDKAARNLVYTGSLLEYAEYLARWREEGDFQGTRVVRVERPT